MPLALEWSEKEAEMAEELTQLEREVLTHPTVDYFLDHPLEELGLDIWCLSAANLEFDFDLQKYSQKQSPLPTPTGIRKNWAKFARHFQSLLILFAKIQRDKKDPREETLASDLWHKLEGKQKFCFRWEQEAHNQEITARRKGNMNVLFIDASELIGNPNDQLEALHEIIRQYIQSLIANYREYKHYRPNIKDLSEIDPRHLFLLVDIPNITDFVKKIPRSIQVKINIIRFSIPKIYQEEETYTFDVLARGFYLVTFFLPQKKDDLLEIKKELKKKGLICFRPRQSTMALLIFDQTFPSTETKAKPDIEKAIRHFSSHRLYIIEP